MKKSKLEAAETRRRIVKTAAAEFRRNGIHDTGLSGVMAAAGLTHGGFYRHFDSKDQLVAEACAAAMEAAVERGRRLLWRCQGCAEGDRDKLSLDGPQGQSIGGLSACWARKRAGAK